MARRCGAKHISKSKCTEHLIVGAIFKVPLVKNGTPLWYEAHLQVKMHKTPYCRSHFCSSDSQKWHAAVARSTFVSQNAQNPSFSEPFLKFGCLQNARRCGEKCIWTWKCAKYHTLRSLLKLRRSKMARRCGAKSISKSICAKHVRFATFREVSNWLANLLTNYLTN